MMSDHNMVGIIVQIIIRSILKRIPSADEDEKKQNIAKIIIWGIKF